MEQQEQKKRGTKLHFSRIRKRGDPVFLDPQTDIRKIVPSIMCLAIMNMEEYYKSKHQEQDEADSLYLHNCIKVFQIRILEDPMALSSQIQEFFDAIVKVQSHVLVTWFSQVVQACMCIYALFCRRDSAADAKELHAILEYTRLLPLEKLLSASTYALVKKELESSTSLLVQSNIDTSSCVICHETCEMMEHLKELACMFMQCSGDQDWNSLAAACDREFSTQSRKSTEQSIALALAYPTYKFPTLTVEVEEDNGPDTENSNS